MERRVFLSACLAAAAGASHAQNAQNAPVRRRYAVLSLIGDRLTVVGYVRKVGSAHDTNEQQVMPLNDTVLDTDALRAAEQALRAADPAAPVSLLFAASRKQYEGHLNFFDGAKATLPDDITGPVRAAGATHLVLLTKLRAQASFEYSSGTRTGSGWLEGIGFYVDRVARTVNTRTGQHGLGYLAPYVYVNASLVDMATNEVKAARRITASRLVSASESDDGANPWEALTPQRKIEFLRGLVREGVGEAVEELAKA